MARNSQLLKLRNANIKKRYREISARNTRWRNDAVIDEVAAEFFLSARTISAILNDEGVYGRSA